MGPAELRRLLNLIFWGETVIGYVGEFDTLRFEGGCGGLEVEGIGSCVVAEIVVFGTSKEMVIYP